MVTKREFEIISALAVGATAPEVARDLGVSPHTVRAHIRSIYTKLGVASRVELALWVVRQGNGELASDR